MNQRALRILEFEKIREMLSAEAVSPMAKKQAENLMPLTALYEIQQLLSETSEAVSVIIRKGRLPIGGINDIKAAVLLAEKGGTLGARQLLEIMQNLFTARKTAAFLKTDTENNTSIGSLAEAISTLRKEEEEIGRCILSEDEISDAASPELKTIRRNITRQNEALRSKMNSLLVSGREWLQDDIITLRQGRYVIPVKQEHKAKFPGIIHDQSSTGATLFIEPQAIVNMNNELRELHLAERAEIERILAELSAMVALVSNEILSNQEILIKLDFIFAKARFSVLIKAVEPELNTDGYMRIKEGRHPLIDKKKVVPMSISLGKDFDTLVVTGPNTGGKTVTLKTVGLMVLMTQSGLHIPAEYGTIMPIFENVFADIGDEQSIEQSLSTFSSHMTNIISIVKEAEVGSLVLLDELGAGTDPTEGAALAISILDFLLGCGAKTIATTHYTELKKYALATRNVENASVEFDIETLSPTYKLSIGVPGKSNAFEISRKLGLPSRLIDKAKSVLEEEDIKFEDLLAKINEDRKQAEAERDEAISLKLEMKKMKEDLDRQKQRFSEQKDKALTRAKEEARDMVREMKELSDSVFKELRELEKIQDPKTRNRKYEEIRKKVKNKSDEFAEGLEEYENINPVKSAEIMLGTRVRVLTLGQDGNVLTLPDDKGDLMVQLGVMKVNVNLSNLEKIEEEPMANQVKSKYGAMYRDKTANVSSSIDVRGTNLVEAEADVDKYIDDACIAGLKQVTVIHGKGEGILRNGLKELFKSNKNVASFRLGEYNEGGDGATILTLK